VEGVMSEEFFTRKDIQKLKKALKKAGAKPLTINDMEKMTFEDIGISVKTLIEMDKWASKVLRQAEAQNN
jgi:hypothetical protein